MAQPHTVLVDIRYMARSWRKEWNQVNLRHLFGSRYRPLPCLGNVNYNNDQPIKLSMPDIGIPLLEGLQKGYNLILMCTCKDFEHCHRKMVVDLVKQVLPQVEVDEGPLEDPYNA
jgi:hypothetical protein